MWSQSLGILPLSFFNQTLQEWLQHNATTVDVVLPHQLPWRIYFPFLCWNLWLSRNDKIFNHQSKSQNSIIHSVVQMACEFHFLAGLISWVQEKILHHISWRMPPAPYIKLNTDCSTIGNPGLAGVGGILRNHMGNWLAGFSLHLGIASNNTAELAVVRQGLALA